MKLLLLVYKNTINNGNFIIYLLYSDGDTLVFIDYRSDRMRQITEAFGIERHFETSVVPKDIVSNYFIKSKSI